jgi:hypothetical protein
MRCGAKRRPNVSCVSYRSSRKKKNSPSERSAHAGAAKCKGTSMSRSYTTINNVYGDRSFLTQAGLPLMIGRGVLVGLIEAQLRRFGGPLAGSDGTGVREAQEALGVTLGDAWGPRWGLLGTQGLDAVCHRGSENQKSRLATHNSKNQPRRAVLCSCIRRSRKPRLTWLGPRTFACASPSN